MAIVVSSWPTSAADHCDRLMSWRVPQQEHERVSETGVFPSLDRVSGALWLSHYVTEISHLYSLRDFWRHFGLCRAAAHSDCCFFAPCTIIYLLTYLLSITQLTTPFQALSVGHTTAVRRGDQRECGFDSHHRPIPASAIPILILIHELYAMSNPIPRDSHWKNGNGNSRFRWRPPV